MDDETLVLLSRSVDDDLDAAERRSLDDRLAAEPELAQTLAGLAAMRRSVAAVADGMSPPATLDALLMPLRRGVAPEPAVPRAWRWLAVAASIAAALVAGIQIGQRGDRRTAIEALALAARTPAPSEHEPYQLRALPTSSLPPEHQPLGVAERLLASTPRPPPAWEGTGLDVLGPVLTADPIEEWSLPRLVLRAGDSAYVARATDVVGCTGPRPWAVAVVVVGSRITEVSVDEHEEEALRSCSLRLVGLETPGLRDGRYSGDVVPGRPD